MVKIPVAFANYIKLTVFLVRYKSKKKVFLNNVQSGSCKNLCASV